MDKLKNRIDYIDIAKAFALFFVILGHLVVNDSKLFNWIFSFHMPLFFILSGMTLNVDKYDNIFIFIKRKSKSLIVPYFIFASIGFVVSYFVYEWKMKLTIKRIIKGLFYHTQPEVLHVGQIWFLVALFVAGVLFYILEKYILKNKSKLFTFFIYLVISIIGFNILNILKTSSVIKLPLKFERLPFKVDTALTAVIFLKIGNVIRKYNIIENIGNISKIKYVIFIIVLLCINILVGTDTNGYVNICSCVYGGYINYYLASISGSLVVLLISLKIKRNKILCYYGKNTLPMFAMHSLLIALVTYIASLIFHKSYIPLQNISIEMSILFTIIIYILLFLVSYVYNLIKNYVNQYKIVKINMEV